MMGDYAMYLGIFLVIIGVHDVVVYYIRKNKHGIDDGMDKK